MSSHPLIWFLLLDSTTGQPYKGAVTNAVSLPPYKVVVQFRHAVYSKNPNKIATLDPSDLIIYKLQEQVGL
jgi:hypothetical protein